MLFCLFLCFIAMGLGIDPPVFIIGLCAVLTPPMLLFGWWMQRQQNKWLERERAKPLPPGYKRLSELLKEEEDQCEP